MMSGSAEPLSDQKIKYLDLIQGVINRMASESASMKRYALVAAAAINSTAVGTDACYLAVAGAIVILVFWLVDAQYLRQERKYRALYDRIRQPEAPTDFDLGIPEDIGVRHSLGTAIISWSVCWLHGCLATLGMITAWMISASSVPATP